jgi:hypothetical protein
MPRTVFIRVEGLVRLENLADVRSQYTSLAAQTIRGRLDGGDGGLCEPVDERVDLGGGREFSGVERGCD